MTQRDLLSEVVHYFSTFSLLSIWESKYVGSRNKFSRETKVLISWDRDLSETQYFFDLENSDTKKLKYPTLHLHFSIDDKEEVEFQRDN